MSQHSNTARIKGLTLIELLISITISLLLLTVIASIYLAAQMHFSMQMALSQLSERAYFAKEFIKSDIKLAGYIGCPKLTDDFPIISFSPYTLSAQNKITLEQNSVTIRHASISHADVMNTMTEGSMILVSSSPHFSDGDVLIISDCKLAEIFQVQHVFIAENFQVITPVNPLHHLYEKFAEVSWLEINKYYVSDTGRKGYKGKPIYALYKLDIQKKKNEIIEGVNQLKAKWEKEGIKVTLGLDAGQLQKTQYDYIWVGI